MRVFLILLLLSTAALAQADTKDALIKSLQDMVSARDSQIRLYAKQKEQADKRINNLLTQAQTLRDQMKSRDDFIEANRDKLGARP